MKTVRFVIDRKTGGMTIETTGYEGASCLEATKEIRERLGMEEPTPTAEFYKEEQHDEQRA